MKVANDYAYQKIHSAEEAVLRIRERGQKSQAQKSSNPSPAKSNVPKWSNPDYKNETSEETRLELERKETRTISSIRKKEEIRWKVSETYSSVNLAVSLSRFGPENHEGP